MSESATNCAEGLHCQDEMVNILGNWCHAGTDLGEGVLHGHDFCCYCKEMLA